MKVKSESEVAQSCLTLCDAMDSSLPASSVHGIFQARVLEWGAIAFSAKHPLGPVFRRRKWTPRRRAQRLALRNHSWGCCVNARRLTARCVFYEGCDCFCWWSGYQVPQIFPDFSNSIFPIRLIILLACHLVALRVFSNAYMRIEQKCCCIFLKRIIGNRTVLVISEHLPSLWPRCLWFCFLLCSSWLSSWGSAGPVVSWLVPKEGFRLVMLLRPFFGSLSQLLWPPLVLQAPSPQLELQDWFLVQNRMSQLPVPILSRTESAVLMPRTANWATHPARKGLSEMMQWDRPSLRSSLCGLGAAGRRPNSRYIAALGIFLMIHL